MTDFAAARRHMVDGQVRTADVTDLRIISAMLEVPRERFVPPQAAGLAYLDLGLGPERCRRRHPQPAQADGAGQADPGRRSGAGRQGSGRSAAPPAIRRPCWRRLPGRWSRSNRTTSSRAPRRQRWPGRPMSPSPRGRWSRAGRKAAPYDAILIDGAVEELPAALARSTQGRRAAGLRPGRVPGRLRHALPQKRERSERPGDF